MLVGLDVPDKNREYSMANNEYNIALQHYDFLLFDIGEVVKTFCIKF